MCPCSISIVGIVRKQIFRDLLYCCSMKLIKFSGGRQIKEKENLLHRFSKTLHNCTQIYWNTGYPTCKYFNIVEILNNFHPKISYYLDTPDPAIVNTLPTIRCHHQSIFFIHTDSPVAFHLLSVFFFAILYYLSYYWSNSFLVSTTFLTPPTFSVLPLFSSRSLSFLITSFLTCFFFLTLSVRAE